LTVFLEAARETSEAADGDGRAQALRNCGATDPHSSARSSWTKVAGEPSTVRGPSSSSSS
jgi:hypothetical protein